MRTLLAVPALALALAGCQSLASPNGGTLAGICAQEPLAYAAFQIFAPRADPQIVLRVDQAHAIVRGLCASPPTDLASGLAAALSAYAIIQRATP